MPAQSRASSLADDYYYTQAHSHSPSLSNGSGGGAAAVDYRPGSGWSQSQQQPPVRKQASLAHIHVPPFSAFRNKVSSIPLRNPAPQSRHSPRAASFSRAEKASPNLAHPSVRPLSLDSPLLQQPSGRASALSPPLTEELAARQEARSSHGFNAFTHDRRESIDTRRAGTEAPYPDYRTLRRSSNPGHSRYAYEQTVSYVPGKAVSSIGITGDPSPVKDPDTRSMGGLQQAPSLTLQVDGIQRALSDESPIASDSTPSKDQRPKSPGSRLGNFFSWKSSPQKSGRGRESPTTSLSDKSLSPLPSPSVQKASPTMPMDGTNGATRLAPTGLDTHEANAAGTYYHDRPGAPLLLGSPHTNGHFQELESELAQVSTELASSIRREMDLEDELDRIRMEVPTIPISEVGRRSSDYFSDSGASSTRFPITDPDAKLDELETKLRKVEQEKAQMKLDGASRMQSELSRRRELEQMVRRLEAQLQKRVDAEDARVDVGGRVAELESSLGETRRRLSQERQAKDSFGDLYNATKLELEQHKNERDNLRDEVVPQLKTRLEGLEAEAADTQALMYKNTRLQQELAALRDGRITSIAEEGNTSPAIGGPKAGLSRSGSLARRGGSMTRSGSVKDRSDGGRASSGSLGGQMSQEGIKEIEDQRDALHKALQLLIKRHEKQQRDHERAVKKLTSAKDKAELSSPGRTTYHKEVSFLKDEVTTLRKRTEDALEQKWQYEKGLSGLKMDLDRAEQETRSLRNLLQEHDILASSPNTLLRATVGSDEGADEQLKCSISTLANERDQARQVAEQYRRSAFSVQGANAGKLRNAAQRMDGLADQLESQVQANAELQRRLAEAVAKGEREQRESTRQIEDMQKRLAGMEDAVLAAQQHSEMTLSNHEAEVRRMEEATSPALQRLRISIPDAKRPSPGSSPTILHLQSPGLRGKKKLADASLLEASRTHMLERKVRELEGLLRQAEEDVQVVVQRVNRSQYDVAELQMERDAAFTQMRKLQGQIVEERERAEELMA